MKRADQKKGVTLDYSAEQLRRYKWPVTASQRIAASPAQIWSTIARAGNLNDCHPFCEKNTVIRWPGVGACDIIHYYSGWVLRREFVNWHEGRGYDLLIGREGGPRSYVSWRITEAAGDTGILTITIYPYIFQHLPAAIRWIPYRLTVQPQLRRYLCAVLKGFEYFITTGNPVQKNQFGGHRWFSIGD